MLKHKLPILFLLSLFLLSAFAGHLTFTDWNGPGTGPKNIIFPEFDNIALKAANNDGNSQFYDEVFQAARKARDEILTPPWITSSSSSTSGRTGLSRLWRTSSKPDKSNSLENDLNSPFLSKGQSSSFNSGDDVQASSSLNPIDSVWENPHVRFRYFFFKHLVEQGKNKNHRVIKNGNTLEEDEVVQRFARKPGEWRNIWMLMISKLHEKFPNVLTQNQLKEIWTAAGFSPDSFRQLRNNSAN